MFSFRNSIVEMIICFTGDNQCQFFRHQSFLVSRNLPYPGPRLDPKGLVMRLTFRTVFSIEEKSSIQGLPSEDDHSRVPRVNTF